MDKIQILEKQAIDAAFSNQWEKAIKINKQILTLDKNNLEAILRLGFAYFQLQEFKQAKKIYQHGLKIQPNNPVIIKYLEKIEIIEQKRIKNKKKIGSLIDPELFLEIPGKTKSVALVNLGQKNVLAKLFIGQPVILSIKRRRIVIKTDANEFIGNLPDDIGKRLIILIKAGNQYSCFIKEVMLNRVVVFLREEKKVNKLKRVVSFPTITTTNLDQIPDEESIEEEDEEEINPDDLEKLAESLVEEKDDDYFSFSPHKEEDLEEEEE